MAVSAGTINIRTLPRHTPCDRGSSGAGIWHQQRHHPPPPSSRYNSKVILDRQTAPVMLEGRPRRRLLLFSDRTVDHHQIPLLAYVYVLSCVILASVAVLILFHFFQSTRRAATHYGRFMGGSPVLHYTRSRGLTATEMGGNIDTGAIRFYIIRRSAGPRTLEVRLGLPTPHGYRGICPSLFRYCVSAGTVDTVERQRRSRHPACWLNWILPRRR